MEELLGLNEQDLLWYQMALRAVIVFIVALIFIRLAGMRSFGSHSAFDIVVSITIGGLLSRCITGHYPFFSTLMAAFVIVICHQAFAYLAMRFDWFRKVTEGERVCLFKNGTIQNKNMKRHAVSKADIQQALDEFGVDDIAKV